MDPICYSFYANILYINLSCPEVSKGCFNLPGFNLGRGKLSHPQKRYLKIKKYFDSRGKTPKSKIHSKIKSKIT